MFCFFKALGNHLAGVSVFRTWLISWYNASARWLYAKHSIGYDGLPDYFLAFDLFDRRRGQFLSVDCRNQRLRGTSIYPVPCIAKVITAFLTWA